jgi:hypothetical protein
LTTITTTKKTQPESVHEAKAHGLIIGHAERAGLCLNDAVALANGVQLGFNLIDEPCDTCAVVMATWPVPRVGTWHTPKGKATLASTWRGLA